jgi:hypothetical protein
MRTAVVLILYFVIFGLGQQVSYAPTLRLRKSAWPLPRSRHPDAALVGVEADIQQTWFRSKSSPRQPASRNERLDCRRSAFADIRRYDCRAALWARRRNDRRHTLDTLVQNLMARPEIEKAEQLRGKTLGITRFGTSIDVGARIALRHFGLVPEKDVAIVQVGGMESMVPALQSNRIQAGILSYPAITQAKKLGHHVLLDVASLGMPYAFRHDDAANIREDPTSCRYMTRRWNDRPRERIRTWLWRSWEVFAHDNPARSPMLKLTCRNMLKVTPTVEAVKLY